MEFIVQNPSSCNMDSAIAEADFKKKALPLLLLMLGIQYVHWKSNIIRSRKAVSTTQSLPLPAQSSATTAPAEMDHLAVGPGCPMRRRHQRHQWHNLLAPGVVTARQHH
ncbi:hypothetical protein L3X38_025257 [Prunus dulcis]|uniref:Uncharacterized protein n=1 Tax=Prunus dulcis TaxID=3755 RepID=A0AAD4Z797_PRUDU|nr:hypothetical protein L3X38_025257 [Prunus dulcis]